MITYFFTKYQLLWKTNGSVSEIMIDGKSKRTDLQIIVVKNIRVRLLVVVQVTSTKWASMVGGLKNLLCIVVDNTPWYEQPRLNSTQMASLVCTLCRSPGMIFVSNCEVAALFGAARLKIIFEILANKSERKEKFRKLRD